MAFCNITTVGYGAQDLFVSPAQPCGASGASSGTNQVSSTSRGSGQAFPLPPDSSSGSEPSSPLPGSESFTAPLPPLGSPSRPEPFYPPNFRGGLNTDKFQKVEKQGLDTSKFQKVTPGGTGLDTSKFQEVNQVQGYIWKYQ